MIYDTLYNYQKETFQKLKQVDRGLLALDLGLGKTKTSAALMEDLIINNEIDNLLLVCQSIKVNDWKDEINLFLTNHPDWKIIHLDKIKNNEETINNNPQKTIFITSYSMFAKLGDYFLKNECIFNERSAFFYDECQTMKSIDTNISKAGLNLSAKNLKKVILISGDPISNGYKDLFVIMKILNFKFDGWDDFEMERIFFDNYFVIWKEISLNKWKTIVKPVGYKHIEELINMLHTKSVFKKTEEVIELPEQNFYDLYFEIEKKNQMIFKNMREYILNKMKMNFNVEKQWPINIKCEELIDLFRHSRSLSSGFLKQDNEIVKTGNEKLEKLDTIVNDTNRNVVIFYNFNQELEDIKNRYRETHAIVEINGQHHLEESLPLIQPERTLILVQYKAGATGINLQSYSNIIVYYSPTTSGELYKQSIKRIHRIGQHNPCFYYHLINKNSVDEKIYATIKQSQEFTEAMFLDWINNK